VQLDQGADALVAAGAAVAGARRPADLGQRPQAEHRDRPDEGFFGHLQTAADEPSGASVALLAATLIHTLPTAVRRERLGG
jgi:hypothetical protein